MSKTKKNRGCNPLVAVLVTGFLGLVILVAVLFGAKFYLMRWVQGEGFTQWVSQKASEALHADVQLGDVTWQGLRANVGKITARGWPEASFAKAELNAVRIDVGTIRDQAVEVPEINISQGSIEFSKDRIPSPKGNEKVAAQAPPKVPSFLASYVPNRVNLGDIVIGTALLTVKDDQGGDGLLVKNSRVRISPDLERGQAEFFVEGGDLMIARAPEMKIRQGKLRWQGKSLFINNSALGIFDDGHVELKDGEISFDGPLRLDLKANLSKINVKKVLPEDWQNKISGTLRGPIAISGPGNALVQKGTLYLDNGEVGGLPMLDRIAKYTGSTRFSQMKLTQAETDYSMTGDQLKLRHIKIHSPGLTKIEGQLDMNGEAIKGVLQVGITPGVLSFIASSEKKVFTEERDNMLWTAVNIGGTTTQVTEDLSGRLIAAVIPDILTKLPDSVQERIRSVVGGGEGTTNLEGLSGIVSGTVLNELRQVLGQPELNDPAAPPSKNQGQTQPGKIDKSRNAIETGKKLIEIFGPVLNR